jgi:hypothetical protein
MRPRLLALVLALAGLLVAVAVGLAANSIATRSFTPGADALPSAGSLAPRAPAEAPATTTSTTKPKPKPKPRPKPKPVTTTPATTAIDDHGGSARHGGGKHGGDD